MSEELITFFLNPTAILLYKVVGLIVLVMVGVRLLDTYMTGHITDKSNRYRIKKIVGSLWYIASAFVLMFYFSNKLPGFAVAFWVAGAGIAFALQEVIGSIAWWLAIMFGDFYKAGDRVQLGGIKGDVIDIWVLRTTIMEMGERVGADQYNGRIVRVANSFVFKEPVYNYSGSFPFLRDEVRIPIRYGSDYELTRKLLIEAADETLGSISKDIQSTRTALVKKFLVEDAVLEPAVTIVINDNRVEFTLRYVVGFKTRRTIKDQIYSKILEKIEQKDTNIQFASTTIQLVK